MNVSISFEVFPPKTTEGLVKLARTTRTLDRLAPTYISVTFGAGGSTRDRSFDAIATVSENTAAPVAGHLTCVGMSTDEVDGVIDRYERLGVRHVVALRGDPPDGVDAPYTPHPAGYQRTADLVASLKRRGDFDVSVSAYPERHPQSPTEHHDIEVLARKVSAGADQAITQMFFDNRYFLRLRDRIRCAGIDVPLVPGIFPIHSFRAVSRFAERCGASMCPSIARRFEGLDDDDPAALEVGADIAAEQIAQLVDNGVEHVHIYTLNRADLALAVGERLGICGREVVR